MPHAVGAWPQRDAPGRDLGRPKPSDQARRKKGLCLGQPRGSMIYCGRSNTSWEAQRVDPVRLDKPLAPSPVLAAGALAFATNLILGLEIGRASCRERV